MQGRPDDAPVNARIVSVPGGSLAMATTYQQANRFLTVTTPLGGDKLLLVGLTGTEAISELFQIQLEAIATNETQVPFDQLLGKKITAQILAPGGNRRYLNGICNRVVQGGRDTIFTFYRLEIVPEFWFLTRKAQSRIFQQVTVPEILTQVFQGLNVQMKLQGQYESRDYCVQYRETDFNFASRLMEEEGIFYFFTHTSGNHTMVVADSPDAHPDVPFDSQVTYAPARTSPTSTRTGSRRWEKQQDLRSMKTTLWDHTFELPHKHLEAEQPIQETSRSARSRTISRLAMPTGWSSTTGRASTPSGSTASARRSRIAPPTSRTSYTGQPANRRDPDAAGGRRRRSWSPAPASSGS